MKSHNVGAVPHGLRASFRTWAAEQAVRDPVAEACISHGPKDMLGKAYIRTTFFEERREVMERWATYLVETDPAPWSPDPLPDLGVKIRASTFDVDES